MQRATLASLALGGLVAVGLLARSPGRGEDAAATPPDARRAAVRPQPAIEARLGAAAPDAAEPSSAVAPALDPVAAPGANRRAVAVGLSGRIRTTGGAPVPDVALAILTGADEHAPAHTGRDGRYTFPADLDASYGDVVPRRDGWRFRPERASLLLVDAGEPVDFVGERLEMAPLRLLLVDRLTGEPVPRFAMRVSNTLAAVSVTSDDAGAIEVPFEVGSLRVKPTRGGAEVTPVKHRPGADLPTAFEVDVGPTYHLDFQPQEKIEPLVRRLSAQLVPRETTSARALVRARERGLYADDVGDWYDQAWSPVADVLPDGPRDGLPWVRFPLPPFGALASVREGEGRELLLLDGRHRAARIPVPNTVGICPDTLRVELAPAGALCARVTFLPTGEPGSDGPLARVMRVIKQELEPRAWITVTSIATGARREGAMDVQGELAFRGLAAGVYAVRADSALAGSVERRVEVAAGQRAEVELSLPRDPFALFAGGVLRGRDGPYRGSAAVELVSRADPALRFRAGVEPGRTSAGTGAPEAGFALRGVPPGAYELRVLSADGFRWEPERVLLDAPADDLVFTCRDDAPSARVERVLRDAATGERCEGQIRLWIDAEDRPVSALVEDVVGRPARGGWVALAEGYAPRRGRWEAGADDGAVTVVAELDRGVGLAVFASTPEGDPVAGAEIRSGRVVLGTTDVDGWLLLDRAPDLPLAARRAGYVHAHEPRAFREGRPVDVEPTLLIARVILVPGGA